MLNGSFKHKYGLSTRRKRHLSQTNPKLLRLTELFFDISYPIYDKHFAIFFTIHEYKTVETVVKERIFKNSITLYDRLLYPPHSRKRKTIHKAYCFFEKSRICAVPLCVLLGFKLRTAVSTISELTK